MDGSDNLIGGFASGDGATPAMKREQDSTDDFEHLDRDGRRDETEGSPLRRHEAARHDTQSFLDMERAPPAADKMDHLADKFTDSESDADTAGESPQHVAEPPTPAVLTPAPAVEASAPISEPKPEQKPEIPAESKPTVVEPKSEHKLEPKLEPVQTRPVPEPVQPPVEPVKPKPPSPTPEPPRAPTAHVIEAEVIFCQIGLDAWFDPQRLHPEVESLIYWRCAARSGAALGAGLVLLVALACCSVVSVLAYGSLLLLVAAVSFRVYKNVLQAVQKTNDGHPFKWLLEKDASVSVERAQALAATATAQLNATVAELMRLFLVEDLVDSLKFGVLLWCLTYVGACFNGITLIILGWIALFTVPKAYEMNKAQVDANLELARSKINEISAKVRAAVPLGRKVESGKDK